MTNQMYDLLDELYFVIRFDALQRQLDWERTELLKELTNLLEKGWIKCLDAQDNVLEIDAHTLPAIADSCLFLATKEGLKAHHGV